MYLQCNRMVGIRPKLQKNLRLEDEWNLNFRTVFIFRHGLKRVFAVQPRLL